MVSVERGYCEHDLHVWVGPVGLHLFWPDLWKSRFDWCRNWRTPVESDG